MNNNRLTRNSHDQMVFGVAGGIADYLNIDPVIIRLVFVLLAVAGGHGLLIYLILAIIMPVDETPVAKANAFDEEEIVIKDA